MGLAETVPSSQCCQATSCQSQMVFFPLLLGVVGTPQTVIVQPRDPLAAAWQLGHLRLQIWAQQCQTWYDVGGQARSFHMPGTCP